MNKQQNAQVLDPLRFKIAQQNAVLPGGPQNNNPMNVTGVGQQPASSSGMSQHPYGDTANMYPQMGADILNPMSVGPSGLQQNFPIGQRLNAQVPFGLQQQPNTAGVSTMTDEMESGRLAQEALKNGLNPGRMGMTGMPAQPAPGAFPGAFPGSSGPPIMQGMQSAEMAAGGMAPQNSMNPMTPGSTPTKIKKKRA
jgi:hypothetical protein